MNTLPHLENNFNGGSLSRSTYKRSAICFRFLFDDINYNTSFRLSRLFTCFFFELKRKRWNGTVRSDLRPAMQTATSNFLVWVCVVWYMYNCWYGRKIQVSFLFDVYGEYIIRLGHPLVHAHFPPVEKLSSHFSIKHDVLVKRATQPSIPLWTCGKWILCTKIKFSCAMCLLLRFHFMDFVSSTIFHLGSKPFCLDFYKHRCCT